MKKRKVLSSILAIIMIFSITQNAFAVNVNMKNTQKQEIANKISTILPLLCENVSETCYLGEKLIAYQVTGEYLTEIEYELYPIISDKEIIALAQVTINETGEKLVSCITAYANGLQDYYAQNPNVQISIAFAYDGVYILQENKNPIKIYNAENINLGNISYLTDLQFDEIIYDSITAATPFTPQISRARSLQFLVLNVGLVSNDGVSCTSSPSCDDIGLCWAASMAMIVNYYCNTNHTTSTIHARTGCMSYQTSSSDFKSALKDFGLYVNGAYTSFTYSDISYLIQGNKLAFMRIERSYVENGETKTSGHVVVPYGYYYNPDASSTKYFHFMDPNYGGGIAEFPTSGTLYVPTSGYNYTFDYYLSCWW